RAELAAVLGEQALASTHLTTRSPRVPRELREAGPHEAPAHCERERRARAPPAHPSERGPGLVDLARRGVRLGGREPRVTHEALRPRAVLALRERGRGRRDLSKCCPVGRAVEQLGEAGLGLDELGAREPRVVAARRKALARRTRPRERTGRLTTEQRAVGPQELGV